MALERLAFGEGVEATIEDMTSINNVYSPLKMHCCNTSGAGERNCDNDGSERSL